MWSGWGWAGFVWVAVRAYELYEREGHRDGQSPQNWDKAEQEIRATQAKAEPSAETTGSVPAAVRSGFVRFVLGLTKSTSPVDPSGTIESFQHYMLQEGDQAGRAEFTAILEAHLRDCGFCSDMEPLLRNGISYGPQVAGSYVQANRLSLLPE